MFPTRQDNCFPPDRGVEYRSLVGVPGDTSGPDDIEKRPGGDHDRDIIIPPHPRNTDVCVLFEGVVMNRATFPFFKGKIYHQFHNDMSEDYGRKYNNLRKQYAEEGTMQETDCPENFM
ncbi:unnamed protein product [Ectocarpus sp. CCAP 1310/34]|nr:unnamed protein product [Ectocarpus sp. CCAP 1310/34]